MSVQTLPRRPLAYIGRSDRGVGAPGKCSAWIQSAPVIGDAAPTDGLVHVLVVPAAYLLITYPASAALAYIFAMVGSRGGLKTCCGAAMGCAGLGDDRGSAEHAAGDSVQSVLSLFNPSIVYPLLALNLLYVLFWDLSRGSVRWTANPLPSLLVIIGTVAASVERLDWRTSSKTSNGRLCSALVLSSNCLSHCVRSHSAPVCGVRRSI